MKVCPMCKRDLHMDSDVYCYHDGAKLAEWSRCACGAALAPYANYCSRCGVEVAK